MSDYILSVCAKNIKVTFKIINCSLNTDASIRTHERTRDPFGTGANDDIISETLRERLEELPPVDQPEREISIVTLRKDPNLGLG